MNANEMQLGDRTRDVIRRLRLDIERGEWEDGAKLPRHKELGARYGVSAPTVGRAVNLLRSEGRLVTRRGVGTFVSLSSQRPTHPARKPEPSAPSRTIVVMCNLENNEGADIQSEVLHQGFLPSLYHQPSHGWRPADEVVFLQAVLRERCHGLIAFCSPLSKKTSELLDRLESAGIRVVHIEPFSADLPRQDFVLPDYRAIGEDAARSLIEAGYGELRFAQHTDAPYELLMREGFAQAMDEAGLPFDPARHILRIPGNLPHIPEHIRTMSATLGALPSGTGLFCRQLQDAEFFKTLLAEQGIGVPDSIGLMGLTMSPRRSDATGIDHYVIDRLEQMQEALRAIVSAQWNGIRRLQAPALIRKGSVRCRPRGVA